MSRSRPSISLLTVLFCLAAPACGNSPAANGDECPPGAGGGEFELTVGGAQVAEACGVAVAQESPAGRGWGMQLLSTTDITNISIYTESGGRPNTGTYPIADFAATDGSPPTGEYVVLGIFDEASIGTTLTSVTGTLTILSSSAGQVSGSFEFSARQGTEGAANVTVTGTFTADNEDT